MNVFKRSVNGKLVEVSVDGEPRKLGDKIAKVATPIARALRLSCIDEYGQLKPQSGCAKRRDAIDRFADATYDFFWPKKKAGSEKEKVEKTMQFIVSISVEAETLEEALEMAKTGKGKTESVQPRPAKANPTQFMRPNPTPIQQMTGVQPPPRPTPPV